MKGIAAICLLVCLAGCISSRPYHDSFTSLQGLVKQKLAGRCDCGPVTTNEVAGTRLFEVIPPESGCRILVFEREFVTQKEWDRRYASATNLVYQFMASTNLQVDAKTAQKFAGMTNLLELPGWSYRGIGVDVDLQTPEIVYPGSDKDTAKAQGFYDEIVSLLESYKRANKALHATAAAPGS